MSSNEITPKMEEFLSRKLIGRFATASSEGQPHVVPVWFLLEEQAIWISSYMSTRKIFDLQSNKFCALVVDIENSNDGLTAVMIEGWGELVTQPTFEIKKRIERVYVKYLGTDGVLDKDPQTWLNSPENVLIKLTPVKIKTW